MGMQYKYSKSAIGLHVETPYVCIMKFGEGLRAWRIFRGIGQDELSVMSEVDQSTISMLEASASSNEPREPQPKTKQKLAIALKIKPEDFYRLPTGGERKGAIITEEQIIEDIKSFRASGNLSKEDLQRIFMRVARELTKEENEDFERSGAQSG